MQHYMFIEKLKEGRKIVGYKVMDTHNGTVKGFPAEYLKTQIKDGSCVVLGLTLTKNGRLVEAK